MEDNCEGSGREGQVNWDGVRGGRNVDDLCKKALLPPWDAVLLDSFFVFGWSRSGVQLILGPAWMSSDGGTRGWGGGCSNWRRCALLWARLKCLNVFGLCLWTMSQVETQIDLKVAFSLYECLWAMLLLHPGGKPLNPQHCPCWCSSWWGALCLPWCWFWWFWWGR